MSKNNTGSGCLTIFALPFAAVGVLMMVLIAKQLIDWVEVQQWNQTSAIVLEAKLADYSSDDSQTVQVQGKYQYTVGDQTYTSQKISLSTGADNIGTFHEDAYATLARHLDNATPIACYVDPNNPAEAVVFRNLRIEMILLMLGFGMVFGGAGFGLIGFNYFDKFTSAKAGAKLQKVHGATASSGHLIASSTGSAAAGAFVVAVVVCGFTLPFLVFLVLEIINKQNYLAILGLIIPLMGFFVLRWAALKIIRSYRFKGTALILAKHPVIAGERLSGSIHVPKMLPHCSVQLKLLCRQYNRGDGDTGVDLLEPIKMEQTTNVRQGGMQTSIIDFSFDIPETAPATVSEGSPSFAWLLEATADIPGVNFWASFDILVEGKNSSKI